MPWTRTTLLGTLLAVGGCGGGGAGDDGDTDTGTDTETDTDTDSGTGGGELIRPATLEDDRSRLVDAPGAYEWWNFFALDPEREIGVSMIFNSSDPFN